MRTDDVSAVVCTRNSISGIERCLTSLRRAGVGEIILVDAHSSDGTREIGDALADRVLEDPGTGLGQARNIGIAQTSGALVLNMGSDNVMPPGQLELMIQDLLEGGFDGVSARTVVEGSDLVSRGLNAWRTGRFVPGPIAVIGTPTLFRGDLLRAHPFDPKRTFSDDSELCERWAREFGSSFAVSHAFVQEIGKATWQEVAIRCRMYGISDEEVFRIGRQGGWSNVRQLQSILHPLRADLLLPLRRLPRPQAISSAPFLAAFTAMRYGYWIQAAKKR